MSPVSPASAAAIDRIAPDVRRLLVPGTSHFLPMEMPDLVRAEVHALADRAGL
jgi:hypothetical protein